MKRMACAFLCVVIILLGGCSGSKIPAPFIEKNAADSLTEPFESTILMDYGDLSAEGFFSKKAPGYCMIEFAKPERIAGLKAEIEGEIATISFKGESMTIDPDTIPGSAALKIIAAAIDSAVQNQGIRVAYDQEAIKITGENDSGSFELQLDKENKNILKLSSPDNKLNVRFTGFKFLE